MDILAGYLHPDYAYSLSKFGNPRELPHCKGWILERPILDTPLKDAMGCYPLFVCRDWAILREDIENTGSELISLAIVTDPFAVSTPEHLKKYFDIVRPFKKHYVANLSFKLDDFIDRTHCSHYYYAQKSLEHMEVRICLQPLQYLDEWVKLYNNLVLRHKIKGISAFSPESFRIQLGLPGAILAVGLYGGEIVGAGLVMVQGQNSYFHLAAYSDTGYRIRASYGIFWKLFNHLQEQGVRLLDIGGTAGVEDDPKDGLSRFKKGWSNETRIVYLCGRIFDKNKYEMLCRKKNISHTDYFPAYRLGEFN
jgi:hypothetical protein